MISGFQFFKIYQSLHLHFTTKFDILKYGKPKSLTKDHYNNRNDRLLFENLSSKFSSEQAFDFCLSNFVHNEIDWIYKEFSDADDTYKQWKGYFDGIEYNYGKEVDKLKLLAFHNSMIYFNDIFVETKSGKKPPLLQIFLHGEISPECLCILDDRFNFLDVWVNSYSTDDPLLEKKMFLLTKYKKICILKARR